jgi:hypothetical protein
MKKTTAYVAILFLAIGVLQADVFFSDSFDRPNNTDIDASPVGMSGSLSPMTYVEAFEGSGAASIQILSNQLNIAVGAGMSSLFMDHNFIDADILSTDGFSVSLDVVSIIPTGTDTANRWGGFGVGLTRDEALAAGDINDQSTTLRGGGGAAGVCDFYVDVAEDQNLRLWSNGTVLNTINVGTSSGTIKTDFYVSDFNAGSLVTAIVFFNGIQRDMQSFTWDHTAANYIGISGRAASGVFLDNLSVGTVAQQTANIFVNVTNGSTVVKEGSTTDELILSITASPLSYPVVIDIEDILNPNQVTVSPAQVIFTAANWQTPQTVTITAIDDDDMERATHDTTLRLTVTADPESPYYSYSLADVPVLIEDNDCGAWGFNPADFNLDCQVNLEDFSLFVLEWIACSMPDPDCQDFRPF